MTLATLVLLAGGLGLFLLLVAIGLWIIGVVASCFRQEEAAWEELQAEQRSAFDVLREDLAEARRLASELCQETGSLPDLRPEAEELRGIVVSIDRARRKRIPLKREPVE